MNRIKIWLAVLAAFPFHLHAAAYLFDFGTANSAVWQGFTGVTPQHVFANGTAFGWQTNDGLRSQARAYTNVVENKSRGREEPPPIWTNPITEDSISSGRQNAFLIRVERGDYEIYVVCGTSEPERNQFFDFNVQVGEKAERVQIEGGQQFRALRFRAAITNGILALNFAPRSRWTVNAVAAWPVSASARLEKEFVEPFEQATFIMPSAEWAKWKQDPEPETGPMPPPHVLA